MTEIAQRQLRNDVSAVLRRAQAGERFTVTVAGRPVAQLGPIEVDRPPAAPEDLAAIFAATPVDPDWAREVQEARDADADLGDDPWIV